MWDTASKYCGKDFEKEDKIRASFQLLKCLFGESPVTQECLDYQLLSTMHGKA